MNEGSAGDNKMVIILQQTSDNGRRFISTVVEEDLATLAAAEAALHEAAEEEIGLSGLSSVDDDVLNLDRERDRPQGASASSNTSDTGTSRSTQSNCSSSFSLTSQHSISERSAIYKRRIDSLFGRQSKFNSFKPHLLEPFCIKIEDQIHQTTSRPLPGAVTTTETSSFAAAGALGLVRTHSHRESQKNYFKSILHKGPSHRKNPGAIERPKQLRLCVVSSDDDDDPDNDYQKISDNNPNFSSIVTDSLSNLSRFNQVTNDKLTQHPNRIGRNVTSVRITCEESHECGDLDRNERLTFMRLCDKMGENAMAEKNGAVAASGNRSEAATSSSAPCSSSSAADILWRNGDYGGQVPCMSPSSSSPPNDKDRFNNNTSPNLFHGCDLRFAVDYLGCIPVEGNTTALEDLQTPLCTLYTNYLNGKNILNGQLAITKDGLRFESPKLRLVNPFATIAVWAAIKFVARGDPYPNECAFMPLISDPEGQDKGRLFGEMSEDFARVYRSKLDVSGKPFRNPPLFACVMREATFTLDCHAFVCRCAEDAIVVAANLYQSLVDKMKSNGGNIPNGPNGGKREGESGYGTLTRNSPANNHHHTTAQNPSSAFSTPSCSPPISSNAQCCQLSSSGGGISVLETCCSKSCCGITQYPDQQHRPGNNCHDSAHSSPDAICSDSESLLIPIRPPRRNNKKKHGGLDRGCGKSGLKRYNSEDSVLLKMPQRRVSINKARNNCGGHVNNNGYRPHYIKNTKRVKISTPEEELSSSSSATDFQLSESIDQVLDRIINPGGMSFNDLKPSYQQLLLKIALTLTQDQLYQKSKDAMKKHQLPLRGSGKNNGDGRRKKQTQSNKQTTANSATRTSAAGLESEEHSQFLGVFLKSFSKITSGRIMSAASTSSQAAKGTAVATGGDTGATAAATSSKLTASNTKQPSKLPRKIILKKSGPAVPPKPKRTHNAKIEEAASMMSFCSGCACDSCSDKCYCSLPSKQNVKMVRLPPPLTASNQHGQMEEHGRTSKMSESHSSGSNSKVGNGHPSAQATCSPIEKRIIPTHQEHMKQTTDIPVACGSSIRAIATKTCGYDTDSCAGSEKCYCSLQRVKSNGLKIYNINLDTETSDTDTNSYDLEAFNPLEPTTTTSSSSNLKTVSTKSVEILSYHPARRLSYCSNNSNGNNSPSSASVSSGSPNPQQSRLQQQQTNIAIQTTSAMVHQQQQREVLPHCGLKKGSKATPASQTSPAPYFHSSATPKGILCNSGYNKGQQLNKVRLVTGQDASSESVSACSNYPLQFPSIKPILDRNNLRSSITTRKNPHEAQSSNSSDDIGEGIEVHPRANSGGKAVPDNVLSMKKTAEIAAMFTDLHLGRPTGSNNSKGENIGHEVLNMNSKYDTNSDNITPTPNTSTDFQASLGYLP